MLAAFHHLGNNPALPKRRDSTNNYPNLRKLTKWLLHVLSVLSLCLGLGRSTCGQGTLVFNNLGPNDGKVSLFDAAGSYTLLNQDLNFSLELVAPNSTLTLVRNWLLSDGTAKGIRDVC